MPNEHFLNIAAFANVFFKFIDLIWFKGTYVGLFTLCHRTFHRKQKYYRCWMVDEACVFGRFGFQSAASGSMRIELQC